MSELCKNLTAQGIRDKMRLFWNVRTRVSQGRRYETMAQDAFRDYADSCWQLPYHERVPQEVAHSTLPIGVVVPISNASHVVDKVSD